MAGWSSRRRGIETREPSARIGHAEQHVDEPLGLLLPGEERREDGRRRGLVAGVGPVHRDRRSGVDDHGGPRVGGDDAADEFVLAAGQIHRRAVEALGLPLVVRADHDDRDVGRRCRGNGPVHQVGRLGRTDTDPDRGEAVAGSRSPTGWRSERAPRPCIRSSAVASMLPYPKNSSLRGSCMSGSSTRVVRSSSLPDGHDRRPGRDDADRVQAVGVGDERSVDRARRSRVDRRPPGSTRRIARASSR